MLNMNAVAASIVGQQDDTVFICSLFPMHESRRRRRRRSGFSKGNCWAEQFVSIKKICYFRCAYIYECKQ